MPAADGTMNEHRVASRAATYWIGYCVNTIEAAMGTAATHA